jgi:hypothetical protein
MHQHLLRPDQRSTPPGTCLDWAYKSQSDYRLPQWTCPRPARIGWSSFFFLGVLVMIRPCGPCGSCGCTHSLDFLTEPRGRAEESDGVSVSVSFDGSNGPMAQWLNLVGDVGFRCCRSPSLGRSHHPSSLFFSYPSPAP